MPCDFGCRAKKMAQQNHDFAAPSCMGNGVLIDFFEYLAGACRQIEFEPSFANPHILSPPRVS